MSTREPIPFHRPLIGEEEIQEVVDCLRSGWLTSGPRTSQFEAEFRAYVGAAYSLAVNSCTAGLHLALAALEIGPGDEVITTPMTFCATANTILHVGATPVLADIGADGNIDPASIASRITRRTKAIVPVHIAGLPCDMDEIWRLARQHDLKVIEDAAHAVGTHWKGLQIGAPQPSGVSDAVAYSFYATKNLTTGEGGMVTTQNMDLIERMRVLCLHGISRDAWNRYSKGGNWYYQVLEPGYKYNLTDLQSAIGIHQLRKQEAFIAQRTAWARIYTEAFSDTPALEPAPESANSRHSWHLYALRLNTGQLTINRTQFIQELEKAGITASVHFIPLPLHPAYAELAARPENACPKALDLYPRLISLPLHPAMTAEEIQYVAATVNDIATRAKTSQSINTLEPVVNC